AASAPSWTEWPASRIIARHEEESDSADQGGSGHAAEDLFGTPAAVRAEAETGRRQAGDAAAGEGEVSSWLMVGRSVILSREACPERSRRDGEESPPPHPEIL